MYNLTVAQAHTFFVGAGLWLVHNAGRCPQITLQRLSGGVGNDFLQKGLHFNYGDGEFRIQAAHRDNGVIELKIIDIKHNGVPTPKQFKEYFEKNRSAILTQLEKAIDNHKVGDVPGRSRLPQPDKVTEGRLIARVLRGKNAYEIVAGE